MDETTKKNAIIRAMTDVECCPIIQEDVAIQEYTKVPLGQLSAMGATFAAIAPAFHGAVQNMASSGIGETLYRMVIPNGVHGTVNSVGNITNASGKIIGRARFVEAGASAAGTVAQINPAVMLMAIAISAVTKNLTSLRKHKRI